MKEEIKTALEKVRPALQIDGRDVEFVDKCNEYGGEIPGARGVPEDMITKAVKHGVCKVNIDTDLRLAMTAEIRKFMVENPAEFDPRKYLGPARSAIKQMVKHKIKDVLKASDKR